jgi:hypothetical protein
MLVEPDMPFIGGSIAPGRSTDRAPLAARIKLGDGTLTSDWFNKLQGIVGRLVEVEYKRAMW